MTRKLGAILFFALVVGVGVWAQEKKWESKDFTLTWKIEGTVLTMTVAAPTAGWVSVGFNPSRIMKDANIIMGTVLSNGTAVLEDHFGTGMTAHQKDTAIGGTNDATLVAAEEKDGWTRVTFSIPLNSGDSKDSVLIAGKKTVILLASSTVDELGRKHNKKTKVELEL